MRVDNKFNTFRLHLLHAAIQHTFFHFEFRDTITQQTTDAVITFEQRHRMPGAR